MHDASIFVILSKIPWACLIVNIVNIVNVFYDLLLLARMSPSSAASVAAKTETTLSYTMTVALPLENGDPSI